MTFGTSFISVLKQGAHDSVNIGVCAVAAVKSLGVCYTMAVREKVSKRQDVHSPGSGFPSSGQLPASQEPVTAKDVPILYVIDAHNGSEITS